MGSYWCVREGGGVAPFAPKFRMEMVSQSHYTKLFGVVSQQAERNRRAARRDPHHSALCQRRQSFRIPRCVTSGKHVVLITDIVSNSADINGQ